MRQGLKEGVENRSHSGGWVKLGDLGREDIVYKVYESSVLIRNNRNQVWIRPKGRGKE